MTDENLGWRENVENEIKGISEQAVEHCLNAFTPQVGFPQKRIEALLDFIEQEINNNN